MCVFFSWGIEGLKNKERREKYKIYGKKLLKNLVD